MGSKKLVIYPKKQRGDDGYKTFSIRIKEETVDRIDAIAAQTGHSRNELIGKFVEFALDECTVAEK